VDFDDRHGRFPLSHPGKARGREYGCRVQAEDIKLSRFVALTFLPGGLANDHLALELNKTKHSGKLAPSQLRQVERDIAATDAKIDILVYELYGITDDERTLIEGAGRVLNPTS